MISATKIIVNGDDFGKSEDVNESIEFCHRNGIMTSASLIAAGCAFDGAVNISKRNPGLGVGVHLTLDEFNPISKQPSSVLDPSTSRFYSKEKSATNAKWFKYSRTDLVKEYAFQVEKVLDSGILITHMDHHHHLHLFWPVLDAMVEVAGKYGIPYIRSQKLITNNRQSLVKKIYRTVHQYYLRKKTRTTDGYFDLAHADFEGIFDGMVKAVVLNRDVIEIVAHPHKENKSVISFLTNEGVNKMFKTDRLINFGNI
ncbi:MAG: ChbG/HpnK family deacetylase [Syntrophobacterales bacterium]|nr:ChbG/HpnK family deacetylase [Syntrophobacterales bacterium]